MRQSISIFAVVGLTMLTTAGCQPSAKPQVADPAARRTTRTGEVVGFAESYGGQAWSGIPYAKAPIGSLRWHAPRRPDSWSGVRDALQPGSPCLQLTSPFGGIDGKEGEVVGSEDCLYLNVFSPRFGPEQVPRGRQALPVMVWIHGGGNSIGQGSFYNGGNLAVRENVIVVTFNYRLGPFGWFRNPALGAEDASPEDRSGNYGTLDIVRALEWVQTNIAGFGGDPNRVTVFGESAGGLNTYSMLLSPKAKGLFHRAIVESGGLWVESVTAAQNLVDDAEPGHAYSSSEIVLKLLIADGKAQDRAEAKKVLAAMTTAQVHGFLMAQPAARIFAQYDRQFAAGMLDMPRLFRDGVVLPQEAPLDALAGGRYNVVPVIVGTNRDENKLFLLGDPKVTRNYFWIIPRARDPRWYDLTAEYLAKMWKATGADQPAAAMTASGNERVFVYRFDWDEEPVILGSDMSQLLGAAHGFEIPFVFGHFDLGPRASRLFTEENLAGRETLSSQMMSYWAQLAYEGAPGSGRKGDLTAWNPWSNQQGAPRFLILDTPAGGGLRADDQSLTREAVLAAVDADPRLVDQKERCRIFAELTTRSHSLTPAEYAQRCPGIPLSEDPWS